MAGHAGSKLATLTRTGNLDIRRRIGASSTRPSAWGHLHLIGSEKPRLMLPDLIVILQNAALPSLANYSYGNLFVFMNGKLVLASVDPDQQLSSFVLPSYVQINQAAQALSTIRALADEYNILLVNEDVQRRLYVQKKFANYARVHGLIGGALSSLGGSRIRACK